MSLLYTSACNLSNGLPHPNSSVVILLLRIFLQDYLLDFIRYIIEMRLEMSHHHIYVLILRRYIFFTCAQSHEIFLPVILFAPKTCLNMLPRNTTYKLSFFNYRWKYDFLEENMIGSLNMPLD